jgi:hypothetical protein
VFRFLLRLEDGEPPDPAVFVAAVPNWAVGETIMLGHGERLRKNTQPFASAERDDLPRLPVRKRGQERCLTQVSWCCRCLIL